MLSTYKMLPGIILLSLIFMIPHLVIPRANAAGKIIKDIEFAVVQGQSLKLDLYLPDKPKGSGLVVWIHGGGWRKGSKEKCFITWLPDQMISRRS